MSRPRIVAHRGASHEAPENTLAAFRRAWELGVECVELDVRVTRDNFPVVIHDDDTLRTTGYAGKVADQTLAELLMLDAGSWKDEEFADERIPTLEQVVAELPEGRTLFVEIKSGPETAPVIANALRGARGILLQGFDPYALAALAHELPGTPAYWTVDPPVDNSDPERPRVLPYPSLIVAEAARRGFAGLALLHEAVNEDLLLAARQVGLLVDVWTINDPFVLARWHAREVRWIETDRPDLAPPVIR